jgi:drug/metabolite transporter (DMT)-like permease
MILSFAVLAFTERTPFAIDAGELPYLFGFGALQLAGGMLLFTYGVRLIPAAEGALLSIIETVAAPFWVFLVFGEDPGFRALLGGAIVLATIIVYTSLDLRRRPLPA